MISTIENIIYFKETIFQGSTKPIFTSKNRAEISRKNIPFSKMLLLE
jgi:hypothetical protein